MYSLTPSEHLEVVRTVVEEAHGQTPVISGTGFNRAIAVDLARQSEAVGVDAILALPPYYPNSDEDGLAEYYKAIGAATRLPLLVYSRDWVNPGGAWVERLAGQIPNLTAWKDGQGDIRRYQQIMNRVGERLHWIGGAGDDCVPAYYSTGIRAYTSSIATVCPKLSLLLHEAASAADIARLNQLMHRYVIPLYALRARRWFGLHSLGMRIPLCKDTGVFMMWRVRTVFFPRNPYLFSDMTWGYIYVLHGLAGVGFITLVIVHIYFAIRPEKLPITASMIVGSMSREFYLKEHDPRRWKVAPLPNTPRGVADGD